MINTTITKVDSAFSPVGLMGQHYLASGVRAAMRLWRDEEPGLPSSHTRRDYEVIGFVLKGRARLEIEGQVMLLNAGDSYVVPRGALHKYTILETFSAVEATSPPAHVHARDEHNVSSDAPSSMRLNDEGERLVASLDDHRAERAENYDEPEAVPAVTTEQIWLMTAVATDADADDDAGGAEGDLDLGGC
jgi:quercetin dioxygenase-like cupin family protein